MSRVAARSRLVKHWPQIGTGRDRDILEIPGSALRKRGGEESSCRVSGVAVEGFGKVVPGSHRHLDISRTAFLGHGRWSWVGLGLIEYCR